MILNVIFSSQFARRCEFLVARDMWFSIGGIVTVQASCIHVQGGVHVEHEPKTRGNTCFQSRGNIRSPAPKLDPEGVDG